LNYNEDAMKLILNNAFIECNHINKFNKNNTYFKYSKFARKDYTNFCFAKVFDIDKLLLTSAKHNMEQLVGLGIDFILKEILKDNKTTG